MTVDCLRPRSTAMACRCSWTVTGGLRILDEPPRLGASYPEGVMRTYEVRTYGCQMNVHDSERLSGLLEEAGDVAAPAGQDSDVCVLNTCAVSENADNKLYGNLGHLTPRKAASPGMQIAVGGCLAQKGRAIIVEK